MKKYKLKDEVKKYFSKELHEKIEDLLYWAGLKNIEIEALEEVEKFEVKTGYKMSSGTIDKSEWRDNEANFYFTIVVKNIKQEEYHNFDHNALAKKIQIELNKMF